MANESKTGITIDGTAIQALMVKAILETWSEEQRNDLVEQAIAELFKDRSTSGYGQITVIEYAMKKGAEEAANGAVAELLLQPEYKERFYALVKEEFEKALMDPEESDSPIRRGIAQGIRKELVGRQW